MLTFEESKTAVAAIMTSLGSPPGVIEMMKLSTLLAEMQRNGFYIVSYPKKG